MIYRSDRQITEDLLPVRLIGSILWYGLEDKESGDGKILIDLVKKAESDALDGVDTKRAQKLLRRVWRVNAEVLKPFQAADTHVGKFGLVCYYVLHHLMEWGLFVVPAGSALEQVVDALLNPEGTLTEFANIERVDASAHKQARKLFAVIQEEGLFREVVWDE